MNPSNLTLTSCSRRLKVEIITDIRSEQYHQSTSRHQRIASHELINYMYQLTAERPFGLPYQAVGRKYSFIVVSSPDYLSAFCGVLFCQWSELNWTELNWTELNWTELNWSRPVVLRYLSVYCVVLPRLYLQCLTVHFAHFISRLCSSIMSLWMEMSLWDRRVEEERELQTERFRDFRVAIVPIDYDIVLSSATPGRKCPIIQLVTKCFQALSSLGSKLLFNLLKILSDAVRCGLSIGLVVSCHVLSHHIDNSDLTSPNLPAEHINLMVFRMIYVRDVY
jgi:hypothetical protein